jgi:delta 1-pyrroline-5-carboxylate dehydrogenase
MRKDFFAPVLRLVSVRDMDEALALDGRCPYALGATVFGPEEDARALARRLRAGAVVVNDAIVPTADPRLPFGGHDESGFGVTRGAEGLLALTRVKAVAVRRGNWLPHLQRYREGDADLLAGWLRAVHSASWGDRLKGVMDAARSLRRRGRNEQREG